MKNTLLAFLVILFLTSFATKDQKSLTSDRYITVEGSAEIMIPPDEIKLEIILREYDSNHKMEKIESQFLDILSKNKIETKKIELSNPTWQWHYWWSYRNTDFRRKRYSIILDRNTDLFQLSRDLNKKWVESTRVISSSNKEEQQLRKEVKIAAVKAAKEKAEYLLESIGEDVGPIISIEEVPKNQNYINYWGKQRTMSNVTLGQAGPNSQFDHIASNKMRYAVTATFQIL